MNIITFNLQIWLVEMIFIVLYFETICSKKEVLINYESTYYDTDEKSKSLVFNYFLIISIFVSHSFYICFAFHMYIF